MLSPKEAALLKDELLSCKNPLFLFHDDPDGLASFLLCYRFLKEGRGLPVKAFPNVTEQLFARKVIDSGADKVFVLDVAMVEQEFIDAVKVPVVWVDHHELQERDNVLYMNPQRRGVNVPTPVLVWQAISDSRPEDLWIATVGSVGDWHLPDFAATFRAGFPSLLQDVSSVEEALFESPVGILVKVFSFNLKGAMKDVMAAVKTLTRIESPFEILDQTTSRGKLLWRRYEDVNVEYERMLSSAMSTASDDKLFVYTYSDDRLSLTKDVSNELLYRLKDKVVIVGRERLGEVRCSLRSPAGINVRAALERALVGVEGHGGGHENACGAGIKKEDFAVFLDNLRRELNL